MDKETRFCLFFLFATFINISIIMFSSSAIITAFKERERASRSPRVIEEIETVQPEETPFFGQIPLNKIHELEPPIRTCSPVPLPTPWIEEEEVTPLHSMPTEQTPTIAEEWSYYLATSYSLKNAVTGNRGEDLTGKKAVAMWQTDAPYPFDNFVEPFYSFYKDHSGDEYGALPYGTKIEMRVWTGSEYKNLGIYEVLDDSPTTQYVLSDVVQHLSGATGPLSFSYEWPSVNYKGDKTQGSGIKRGYVPNWLSKYSNKIIGWIDVLGADWGMVIVEIRKVG